MALLHTVSTKVALHKNQDDQKFECKIRPLFGPRREKACLQGFANNTGTDQPAHPCRLISAFSIRLLESIIPKLTSSKISIV